MRTVITYGTFDLFHIGHVRLLKRLKDLGDRLVVGCSTDEFNDIKGKRAVYSYDARQEILNACIYVDEVFPENDWGQKADDIRRTKADILAMGDDWTGKFDDLAEETGCIVTYLPRTPDISTTDVKAIVQGLQKEKILRIQSSVKHLENQISTLL